MVVHDIYLYVYIWIHMSHISYVYIYKYIYIYTYTYIHCFNRSLAQVITLVVELIGTYGIHHWRIFRSSYGKLACVGFEPTITEFPLDGLADWAIRPWVQLALRGNSVQLLQFHLFFQCSRFISVFAFVSRQICFKRSLAQVIVLVAEWIDAYGIHHWRIFRSDYRNLAWVGFESTLTQVGSDALTNWAIRPWVQLALGLHHKQCASD